MPILTTTQARESMVKRILAQNNGLFDDLSEIVTNPDESIGAEKLKEDLEEYSFAHFGRANENHPLHDITGDVQVNSFNGEGVLLVHEDEQRIPLYAIIYLDHTHALRGYVPLNGNPFNPQTGKPYGEGGIYDGVIGEQADLDTYDDVAAESFGYTSYADLLDHLPDAWSHLYNKEQIVAELTDVFQTKPTREIG